MTTGRVRGIVQDPAGAVVPSAKVTITSKSTNVKVSTQSSGGGEFFFNDLLPGDYTLNVEAANFSKLTLNDLRVELNQTTDVTAHVQVGAANETVEVNAAGTELVDTTTATLSKGFSEKQVIELAQTGAGGTGGFGVNNLALLAPNVSSAGGIGVGIGGAVGGQRPRNNNFVVDGVDNNDKSITGPQLYVSPETVQEFSLLANQFSSEFGRTNGGQFITVTKSGTNQYHGTAYGYFRNRSLNALDNTEKLGGRTRETMARSDYGRFGGNVGGPILKNRLFFFGSYERIQTGEAISPASLNSPTAAGLATIAALPGISATNLDVFRQYVPTATTGTGDTINVCAVVPTGGICPTGSTLAIPVGVINVPAPNFSVNKNWIINLDFTQSERSQHRGRFIYNDLNDIDNAAQFSQFFVLTPNRNRLFSYTFTHTFNSRLTNETRLAYRRSDAKTPVNSLTYPGLDSFPNIRLNDIGVILGPDDNAPQFGIENNYQFVNNTNYLIGNHSLKFGVDMRKLIAPQSFVQRERGDYEYSSLDIFLRDLSPDGLGERTVGASPYDGNQKLFFPFIQDEWRVRQNLTLNLGLNYSYQSVTAGAKLQALNAISSVPGLIEFNAPKAQRTNFAPKIGLAYSPNFKSSTLARLFGAPGQSSIRAGFSMGYDYVFDNLFILALPPQANQTRDTDPTAYTPNFLASGAIPNTVTGGITDPAVARSVTGAYIPDQKVPYAVTYTLGIQRQFKRDWEVEVRYLGTRGIHLLTQNRINRQVKVSPELGGLPTFASTPTQAQLDALTLTLDDIQLRSNYVPAFDAAGFNPTNVVGFLSNGNSEYHSFSTQLNRRFSAGFQATAAYTWSHLIDDTTAEVFSTVLSPRRVQDFQNLRADKADSALDRRHRFVFSGLYELPFFKNGKGLRNKLLGGFNFTGTLTFESGEKATVLSGTDSNLNDDIAGDRTIRNPNGVRGTGSAVTELLNSAGQVVGYQALNPNAEYIQAGPGVVATSARNTLQMPGINNLDFSFFKNFALTESKKLQFRMEFYNAFNHPQYIPGSPNSVASPATTNVGSYNTVGNNDFNKPDQVFSSNPRVIQMALRLTF
ncbi:MAG TPA: carboxypeptidase regulatory-like domain-containing protein [Blastocatellia bacterium]|nr:carboxypeptidase regulatory-like domain-containing protein [Blastocatellia bacterium]